MKAQPIDRCTKGVNGRLEEVALECVPHNLIEYTQIIDATHVPPMTAHPDDEKKSKVRHYDYP